MLDFVDVNKVNFVLVVYHSLTIINKNEKDKKTRI